MGNYKRGSGNYKSSYLVTKVKQVDEGVNNSTTLQDDDELFLPLKANKVYVGELVMLENCPVQADIKTAFSIPTGATGEQALTGGLYRWSSAQGSQNITTTIAYGTVGNPSWNSTPLRVVMGGTAGNLQLRWCQNTLWSPADSQVLKGSYIMLIEGK